MSDEKYQEFIKKYTPKPKKLINALVTFFAGGLIGLSSEISLELYEFWFNLPRKESGVLVILTLISILQKRMPILRI